MSAFDPAPTTLHRLVFRITAPAGVEVSLWRRDAPAGKRYTVTCVRIEREASGRTRVSSRFESGDLDDLVDALEEARRCIGLWEADEQERFS